MSKKYPYLAIFLLLFLYTFVFPTSEKAIYIGSFLEPESLDPGQSWDSTSTLYSFNIFDKLVQVNPETMAIEPSLAQSWETKDNGTVWIFKLRKGVTFHDGTSFDADAVVFSFKRQMDKTFTYRYYQFPLFDEIFSNLKDVKAIDTYTVAFYLEEPFYPFLATLTAAGASIVSPTAVKKHQARFTQNPVGTGPYMLKTWTKGNRLVLEANPNYWRGKPGIPQFICIFNPKYEPLHNMFLNGKLDLLLNYSISRSLGLKKLDWVTIKSIPSLSIQYFAFNLNNPLLKKKKIRKALRYLWNKRILKLTYQDYVTPTHSLLPRGMYGYEKAPETETFSIEKAGALLKEEKQPPGIVLEFPFLYEGDILGYDIIKRFSQDLKSAGIELKIIRLSAEEYTKRIAAGDYDLTFFGWVADYPDPHSIISSMFNSQLQKEGFPNLSSFGKNEILSQITLAAREGNPSIREKMYKKINRTISDEVLCIPLFQNNFTIIYNNKKIDRIVLTPLEHIPLFEMTGK